MTSLGTAIWLEASYQQYCKGPPGGPKPTAIPRQRWLAWLFPTWKNRREGASLS